MKSHDAAAGMAAIFACASLLGSHANAEDGIGPRKLLAVAADEDWGFLSDSALRTDPFDPFKYIPLDADGTFASIGGEARLFYEGFRNEDYGTWPGSSSYGESRVLLHGEITTADHWRVFTELQESDLGDRPGGPRPTIDKDVLDVLEGFVEWRSTDRDDLLGVPSLTARLGRQELDFGAGRIFSSRAGPNGEGPNVLQGMDVARVTLRGGPWRLDVFGGRPVQDNPGIVDDGDARGQAVWGVYLTHGGPDAVRTPSYDLYYFGTERPNAVFYGGSGYEHRHTMGARAYETGAPFDYDLEAYYQLGNVGSRDIEAGGIALQVGWTFQTLPGSPRLGALAGADTGGSGQDVVRTFYPPFPRGAYFGNLRAIGPENTAAAELSLDLHPLDTLTMSAGCFSFWRTSSSDGVYALSGAQVAPPVAHGRFVGWQPVASATWHATPHLSLNFAYETFRLGTFLEQTPGLKPINYTAAWAQFRF